MEPWLISVIALGVLGVLSVIPMGIKWRAERIVSWFNLRKSDLDRPIDQYTRLLLDENGLADVEVEVMGAFASLFIGNTYTRRRRAIRLSYFTVRRATKTNLAVACRLVGLAKNGEQGGRGAVLVSANRFVEPLSCLLIPLFVVGLIVDLSVNGALGARFLTLAGEGIALTLAAWVFAIVTYGANKRALADGQYLILASGLLSPEEEKNMKSLFAAWRQLYFFDALLTAFVYIWLFSRLIASLVSVAAKKK